MNTALSETHIEMIGLLNAISIVSKRLAKNIELLEKVKEERENEQSKTTT